MKKTKSYIITATINAWSVALSINPRTIQRRLNKIGVHPGKGELLPADVLFKAFAQDAEQARARKLAAEADLLEQKLKQREGVLCEWPYVEQQLNQRICLPLLKAFDMAPADVDVEWVEKVLKPVILNAFK